MADEIGPKDNNKAIEQVDAIGAAMGLTAAVSGLAHEVREVKNDERRTRFLARMLVVSLIFDLLITVGIGFLSVSNHSFEQQLRNTQVHACIQTNSVRAADVGVVKELLGGPSSSAAQAAAEAKFLKDVEKKLAPVDCDPK